MATRRQRWMIGFSLFVLAVGLIAVWFSGAGSGPVHNGRSLQEWFDSLSAPGIYSENDTNVQAIVAIGNDAVPFLLHELSVADWSRGERFRRFRSRIGLMRRPHSPAGDRRAKAYYCLLYLGPKADSALPELIKFAQDESHPGHLQAIGLLGVRRSNPATVIPVLQKIIAEPRPYRFSAALYALSTQGTNARPALPRIKEIQSDTRVHNDLRIQAAHARVAIDPTDRQSLEFIIAQWEITNANRSFIERMLRDLGTNAMPALPAMRRMVQTESDNDLRHSLSNSIHLLETGSPGPRNFAP